MDKIKAPVICYLQETHFSGKNTQGFKWTYEENSLQMENNNDQEELESFHMDSKS